MIGTRDGQSVRGGKEGEIERIAGEDGTMGLVEREHLIVSASVRRRRHRRFHFCGASLSVYPLVRQFLSEPEDADAKLPSRPLPLVHPLDQGGGRGGGVESGEERVGGPT